MDSNPMIIRWLKVTTCHHQALHLTAASPERGCSIDGPGAKCRVLSGLRWLGPLGPLGPGASHDSHHGWHGISMIFLQNHREIMGKDMENGCIFLRSGDIEITFMRFNLMITFLGKSIEHTPKIVFWRGKTPGSPATSFKGSVSGASPDIMWHHMTMTSHDITSSWTDWAWSQETVPQ